MVKKISLLSVSAVSSILLMIWRTVMLGNGADPENGFLNFDYTFQGYILAVVIILLSALFFIGALIEKDYPVSPRKHSYLIAVMSFVLSAALFVDAFENIRCFKDTDIYLLADLLLFATAFYILAYGFSQLIEKRLNPYFSLIPVVCFLVNLAIVFVLDFKIVNSQEKLLDIFARVCIVLYFELFSKFLSKTAFKKVRKLFFAVSLLTSTVALTYGGSNLLISVFFSDYAKARSFDIQEAVAITAIGLFAIVFAACSYLKKDAYTKWSKSRYGEYDENEVLDEKLEWDSLKSEKE